MSGVGASFDTSPVAVAPPAGDAPAPRVSRRRWLKRLGVAGATAAVAGVYANQFEPFRVEYHEVTLPVRNLPEAFEGFRIAQLTDLHASSIVPLDYLRGVVGRVNAMRPDHVAITGDMITHETEWCDPVCDVLAGLDAPASACLGNHDYDTDCTCVGIGTRIADRFTARFAQRGGHVLRNAATPVTRNGSRLWFIGLEDLYTGLFDADVALRDVPPGEPVIALSHNPDTAVRLDRPEISWILSGHTHGGQVRLPFVGAPVLPVKDRRFDRGMFRLAHAGLYVSRGVGCLRWRVRFMCPPEVPLFVLRRV